MPPDFDIDFSWKDRDEVQDYIFKRYGKNHAVLLGATSTFKEKSITREIAKVFGLPKEEIDLLIDDPSNPYNKNEVAELIVGIGAQIENFPNHRTIHAGGILVTEEPITYYTAGHPPRSHADGSSECVSGRSPLGGVCESQPGCQGHTTHDHHSVIRACYVHEDYLGPSAEYEQQGRCPRGCDPANHRGTATTPRPKRRPPSIGVLDAA